MRFRQVKTPNRDELTPLTHIIAQRVGRYLERQGLVERDTGNVYLTSEAVYASDDDPSNQLLGSSITYRIAIGPHRGRKVFTLQTLPDIRSDNPFNVYLISISKLAKSVVVTSGSLPAFDHRDVGGRAI